MSEVKHTPGPWFIGESNPHEEGLGEVAIMGQVWPTIGMSPAVALTVAFDNFPKMQTANNHLIAAAPDLLEALKDMVSDRNDLSQATIDYALATIAKAEGATDD